ncbi:MAG: hypothetical protein C0448_06945 [Sphingobacteriaceae bacterium]|nr:hypothetical protein [Sphingobacteriaceae bacterium]
MNDNEVIFHYLYQKVKTDTLPFEYKFSNQFDINTVGHSITINKNPLYVNDFYGSHISNLSIVVGSNGSGKTTLCEKLVNFINDQSFYFETCDIVFVYSVKGKLFGNMSEGMTFSGNSLKFELVKHYSSENISWQQLLPVYLTFVFNYSSESILNGVEKFSSFFNLSTTHLLKNAAASKDTVDLQKVQIFDKVTFTSAFSAFKENEFNRNFRISDNEKIFKDFNLKIPTALKVSINKDAPNSNLSETTKEHALIIEKINKIWLLIANNKNYSAEQKFKLKFINKCIISIIRNYKMFVIPESTFEELIGKQFIIIINTYFEQFDNPNFIKDIYNKITFKSITSAIVSNLFLKYYYDLDCIIDEISKENQQNTFFNDSDFILLDREKSLLLITKFKDIYFNESITFKPLLIDLSHGNAMSSLSSGELTLLSLFGRLFDIKLNDLPANLLIMIDEADLTLHPQWQKKYLKNLLIFLNDILPDYLGKKHKAPAPKIQLLITTHSPIILSDVISNSVIYLDKGEHKNKSTFAQNIHELFNNDFVLQNGLIGDYAQSEINKIIDSTDRQIKHTPAEFHKLDLIIQNISDPFIRFKLIELLKGNVDETDIEILRSEKIKLIDAQIEKLQELKIQESND